MIKKYSTLFLGLFIGVSVIHLWGQINGYFILADTTKAMVIPTLGIWTYIRHNPSKRYGIALFFSWLGDLLLIPDGTSFFMIGIVSFLLTQLLYCYLMMQRLEGNFKQQFTKKKALLPLVLLGSYLIFIYSLMGESLGSSPSCYTLCYCPKRNRVFRHFNCQRKSRKRSQHTCVGHIIICPLG